MLSLIVCSINPNFLESLKKNVSETIGVPYEWLIWDNRSQNKGICEVYNKLAESAKYPYLCFLHEDLLFKTGNWGGYLTQLFSTRNVGLIGIAGSDYKSKFLSGWYSGGGANDYSNIYHRNNQEEFHLKFPKLWSKPENEVVMIDGVFMACPATIWTEIKFNERLLKGFHFYDIDFSLKIAQNHKVLVTDQIDMIHLTVGGDFGDRWVRQAIIFHNHWKNLLPVSIHALDFSKADRLVAKYWLDWLKNYQISFRNRMKWVSIQKLFLDPKLWYSITKFLSYRPLRMKYLHRLFKKKQPL